MFSRWIPRRQPRTPNRNRGGEEAETTNWRFGLCSCAGGCYGQSRVPGLGVGRPAKQVYAVFAMDDLSSLAPLQLLALHARVSDELRARGITRSSNNPNGDLAEFMFCKAFEWNQAGNSHPSIDAIDSIGARYQIKGRRITRFNKSRQLSAIRNLVGGHFDYLAGILFDEDYSVLRAAIIPRKEIGRAHV